MLTGNGVPNDVIGNFNSLSIICLGPVLNVCLSASSSSFVICRSVASLCKSNMPREQYGLYPLLRKSKIRYGPVARITTGFFLSTIAGVGYCVLCYKAYQTSPCGWYGSSDPLCVEEGLVSPISLWWEAIPYALGGFSELFINVPGMTLKASWKSRKVSFID